MDSITKYNGKEIMTNKRNVLEEAIEAYAEDPDSYELMKAVEDAMQNFYWDAWNQGYNHMHHKAKIALQEIPEIDLGTGEFKTECGC